MLLILSKVSVEKVFMHYFKKMCQLLGFLPPDLHRGSASGPRWGLPSFKPPHFLPWEKNPADAHGKYCQLTASILVHGMGKG